MRSFAAALLVFQIFSDNATSNNRITAVDAFASPTVPLLGIGSILFRPPNLKIVKSAGDEDKLVNAGTFFIGAFWANKVGGGAKTLSKGQAATLERQQIAEFKKRYRSRAPKGGGKLPGKMSGWISDDKAELVLLTAGKGEIVGVAGIEVETIKKMDGYDGNFRGPLMSNLAIGQNYRRKGLAEDLVRAAEKIARKEWGYDECYLYVEKRNAPAVKLYQKMGYRTIWEDDTAKTLLPQDDGRVVNGMTTIVCMKKKLGGGIFANFFR